jgi:rhodanese-related sulfurtransferase
MPAAMTVSNMTACFRMTALAAFIAFFTFLAPQAVEAKGEVDLSPEAAMGWIMAQDDNPGFVLLDVRTPGEYNKGHIQGAKLLDYYHPDFLKRLKSLDRGKTYLLYCRTGNRSGRTLDLMGKLGFKQGAHLAGGIVAWQGKGYSLVKSKVVNPDLVAP